MSAEDKEKIRRYDKLMETLAKDGRIELIQTREGPKIYRVRRTEIK